MGKNVVKYGIFTKTIHVEKIVNYLNQNTELNYIISTNREEVNAYNFDIGVSYCFPYKVDVCYPVMDKRAWYNYHPAPLPDYQGLNNYSFPIQDRIKEFGVTLHVMTEKIDQGPILVVKRFHLESLPTSTNELGCITHYHLFQLFKETIELLQHKSKTKKEFEKIKVEISKKTYKELK